MHASSYHLFVHLFYIYLDRCYIPAMLYIWIYYVPSFSAKRREILIPMNTLVHGKKITQCGWLNLFGPHIFLCLNAWPMGSNTIRRCGLVGLGGVLLEKWGLLCSAQNEILVSSLVLTEHDINSWLLYYHVCLPTALLPNMMIMN